MAGSFTRTLVFGMTLCAVACGGGTDSTKQLPPSATQADTSVPDAPELASNEGQIMIGDHAVIRQGAVGPLRIGEWRRPVMSFVYVVGARAGADSTDIIVVRGIGKDTVTLSFQNDTLRKIFVTKAGARTADGIGIGTPFATVANQAGMQIESRGKAQVATASSMCGVEFATDSAALSPDSVRVKTADKSATIRAIAIGSCKK